MTWKPMDSSKRTVWSTSTASRPRRSSFETTRVSPSRILSRSSENLGLWDAQVLPLMPVSQNQ
jgi:hypothetical protein